VLALVYLHVPESRDEESSSLDWIGAALATLSLGALTFGLIESSRLGFTHPAILISLVGGVLTTITMLLANSPVIIRVLIGTSSNTPTGW